MENSQKRAMIEAYIHAYNTFDIAGMLKNLHPDIVFQNSAQGQITHSIAGRDAFENQARETQGLFSERKQTITDIRWHEDQSVEVDIDYKATLAHDLPNGLQAGQVLQLQGKSRFWFREYAIVRIEDIAA